MTRQLYFPRPSFEKPAGPTFELPIRFSVTQNTCSTPNTTSVDLDQFGKSNDACLLNHPRASKYLTHIVYRRRLNRALRLGLNHINTMALSQDNCSTIEKSSPSPTEHKLSSYLPNQGPVSPNEISRQEPESDSILVTTPGVYTRHIHLANILQTRQPTSVIGDVLNPPSPHLGSVAKSSSETSPTRAGDCRIQFDLPSSQGRDQRKRGGLRSRSPSPYPGQGLTRLCKEGSETQARNTSEKKARKSIWQRCLDFEASFLELVTIAYDAKPKKSSESDAYGTEKDLELFDLA
ncbi:hypothetical protein F4805DRAFT_252380 [Annulohypoxylon moriforme]|nr:hypothetical protein F4805DRAFT_252380 [Annulohypoxylon moriforme]